MPDAEIIPEDMVNATIMKELKTVQEQIDSCPADRTDLLEEYRKRYDIMKEYAPRDAFERGSDCDC